MENASKALIIAGAILLAILIISLGILIYNQAAGIVNNNTMSDVEITQFNSQFTQYEGTRSGTTVRSLLQEVLSNNLTQDDDDKKVNVTLDSTEIMAITATSIPASEITTGGTYDVSFTYGTSGGNTGMVTTIVLTKK